MCKFQDNKQKLITARKAYRVVRAKYVIARDIALEHDGIDAKALRDREDELYALPEEDQQAFIDSIYVESDAKNAILRVVGREMMDLKHEIKMASFRMRRANTLRKRAA